MGANYITRAQLDRIKDSVSQMEMQLLARSLAGQQRSSPRPVGVLQVGANTMSPASAEKLRLKQLSDERAAKWPNTLEVRRGSAGTRCCPATPV